MSLLHLKYYFLGLEHAFVQMSAKFKIIPKGIQNQFIEIENDNDIEIIFAPNSAKFSKERLPDGSLAVTWVPVETKDHRIQILYKNVAIEGTPWIARVAQKRDYRYLVCFVEAKIL